MKAKNCKSFLHLPPLVAREDVMRNLVLGIAILFPLLASAQKYVDLSKTLFGIEYSFQDEEIVKEPGRMTMTTPYKQERLMEMLKAYVRIVGLPESAIQVKTSWKPGYYINVPEDGKYVINTEPVTIEFNTTPKHLHEIRQAATPIYQAAAIAKLTPYVNPAAERSGMGHIHVGGYTLGESPFYLNENLLRNVLAFFHKHPSLLYGFAEAYDIGENSNIESLHETSKQDALAEVIKNYDRAIKSRETRPNGMLLFLDLLKRSSAKINWNYSSGFYGWFAHYRFINLEHLESLRTYAAPSTEGKFTVEFRTFRPPPTALHAEAMAQLLVSVMEKMSKPGHLEKFEKFSPTEFSHFFTGSKIASDWEKVKRMLEIDNPLLDSMVDELVHNIYSKRVRAPLSQPGYELFESYSEKNKKGKVFELRIKVKDQPDAPQVMVGGRFLEFEKVKIKSTYYWISVIDNLSLGIDSFQFRNQPNDYLNLKVLRCSMLFAG